MTADIPISKFLADEGFGGDAAAVRARALLEADKLTTPRKQAMSVSKIERARILLHATFVPVCGNSPCNETAIRNGREPLTSNFCTYCGYSNNRRASQAVMLAFKRRGWSRLLVVGGTITSHQEIRLLLPSLEIRCIDGAVGSHTRREAESHLQWADVAIVWGATPLPHKVSQLYSADSKTVSVARRGIEAVCQALLQRSASA